MSNHNLPSFLTLVEIVLNLLFRKKAYQSHPSKINFSFKYNDSSTSRNYLAFANNKVYLNWTERCSGALKQQVCECFIEFLRYALMLSRLSFPKRNSSSLSLEKTPYLSLKAHYLKSKICQKVFSTAPKLKLALMGFLRFPQYHKKLHVKTGHLHY